MTADGREGGFIVLHRRLFSSPVWKSLRCDQRTVLVTVLFMANWRPDSYFYGPHAIEHTRGEFSHTLESIAQEAGVTIKVARTTIDRLLAWGFLEARFPVLPKTGTGSGTGPRVLRVVNYSKYQDVNDEAGTGSGTARAQVGHASGTEITSKQEEPVEPKKKRQKPAADKLPPNPRHQPLVVKLTDTVRASLPGWHFKKGYGAAVSQLLALGTDDEVIRLWRIAISLGSKWPGTVDLFAFATRWNDLLAYQGPKQASIAPPPNKAHVGGFIDTRTGEVVERIIGDDGEFLPGKAI